MKINFRQGIVSYPETAGVGQDFLQVVGSGSIDVNLNTGSGQTTIAFAQRNADYLFVETSPQLPAWTGIISNTASPAWLFWDIDTQTGVRTFGQTIVQPVTQNTEPTTPATDLHWFDTVSMTQKVYDGTKFIERIRVFAARIEGTALFPLGTNAKTPYAGTQVGVNQTTFAGQILFAEGLPVIISVSGVFTSGQILSDLGSPLQVTITTNPFARVYTFATTETAFLMAGSQKVNSIRLESDVTTATVTQNIAAYDVVKYSGFGTIEPAGYNDIDTTTLGIVVDGHAINEIATVILQGVVANEAWSWTVVGAELFVETNGNLIETDPNLSTPSLFPVSKPPVARVLSRTEIIFMQGLGKVGPRGLNPESIGTIGDVTLTQPVTAGEVLQFTGSPETWRNDRPVIGDLEDVVINTPVFGQTLTYTGSPNNWRNSFTTQDFEQLNDVSFGSPILTVSGDIIYYDGTNWVNLPRGTSGQILTIGSPLPSWNTSIFGSPADQLHVVGGDGITATYGSPDVSIAVDSTVARLNFGSPNSGSPQHVGQVFTGNQTFADSVAFEKTVSIVGDIDVLDPPVNNITALINFVDLPRNDVVGHIGMVGSFGRMELSNFMEGDILRLTTADGGADDDNGGNIEILCGIGDTPDGSGGDIFLTAGGSGSGGTGAGGDVNLRGGNAGSTSNNEGGQVTMNAGSGGGSGVGGRISMTAGGGGGTNAQGGEIFMRAGGGVGTADGGDVEIDGGIGGNGAGNPRGGNVEIISGQGGAAANPSGDVILEVGLPIGPSGNIFINTRTGDGFTGGSIEAVGSPGPGLVSIYGIGIDDGKAGNVEIWGGYASGGSPDDIGGNLLLSGGGGGAGGDVVITSGSALAPAGDGGDVLITSGASNGSDGDIILSIGAGGAGSPLNHKVEAMRFIGVGGAGSPQIRDVIISNQARVGLTAADNLGSPALGQGEGVITSSFNVYSTVVTVGDSATLPATFAVGTRVYIKNDGAQNMDVFPASGDDAGAGTNTAVTLASGVGTLYMGTVADTTWTQLF